MSINKRTKISIIFLILISIGFIYYFLKTNYNVRGFINNKLNEIQGKTLNSKFEAKIKSGNLSVDYEIDKVLSDIDKFGLNTINLPIVINIEDITSNDMLIDDDSKEKAVKLLKSLKGKKVNIILEAYPWIKNGTLHETEWNPSDIDIFFNNWKTNVLKVLIDDVAIPYRVDAVIIGSNFTRMEYAEKEWCDTIDYVRKYYKGLVTYRTSWWYTAKWAPETYKAYEKKLNNNLFSKLDFISFAAYFELTNNDTNSTGNILSAIESTEIFNRKQNVKQEIKNFYDKWKKPIFFGELGFPKTNKASIHPWDPYQSNIINTKEQANCFEAYKIAFKDESWFLGFSIFSIGEDSEDKLFYPGEESTVIIKNWWNNLQP